MTYTQKYLRDYIALTETLFIFVTQTDRDGFPGT